MLCERRKNRIVLGDREEGDSAAVVREVQVQQLKAHLDAGQDIYLLDVRQPQEHELAALPGSVLIPLGQLANRADEVQPSEGCPIVVYCHHGVRSLSAAAFLEQLGFQEVFSLAGGIDAWSVHIDPQVSRY